MDSERARRQFKAIDDYIATFPKSVQHKLRELRIAVKESAPGAEEDQLWNAHLQAQW